MERPTLPGKYAIATILLLAVVATVYSQWFHARLQRRPVELWGKSNAQLMVNSPLANAMLLAPTDTQAGKVPLERLNVGGERLNVLAKVDVASEPGFSYVRQSLVNEASFDWTADTRACQSEWKYALEFSDGDSSALLLIAPNCATVRLVATGATASMQPVMKGLADFMQDQFPGPKPAPLPASK